MPSKRSGLQERIARRRGAIIASEMSRGANVCFSTEQIAASHRRVLIVGTNKRVRRIARSVHNAGLTVVLPYTTDMARSTRISGIDQAVCVGEKYLPGMEENCHTVFSAACSSGVDAVLFLGSPLSDDEEFLGLCTFAEIEVYTLLNPDVPDVGWISHEPVAPIDDTDWEWTTCKKCGLTYSQHAVEENHYVCPGCGHYLRIDSATRIDEVLDHASFEEWDAQIPEKNPLGFPGYEDKLARQREKSGKNEGVTCGKGTISGIPCAFAVMDSTFFMASMGSVVGEKITRMVERATEERLPVIIFCASGGARMQEGLVSLMQMAKVSAALERHSAAGLLYVSVITDPTTGGVTASFATQGDIILAEPGALIGFAGRRVIQDTIKQELPDDFQTAEFALEHGLIDAIVTRDQMRACLANILAMHLATVVEEQAQEAEDELVLADDPEVSAALASAESAAESQSGLLARVLPRVRALVAERMPKSLQPQLPARDTDRTKEELREERRLEAARAREVAAAAKRSARREYALAKAGGKDALRAFRANQAAIKEESRAARARVREAEKGSAWQSVQIARNVHRPTAQYYIGSLIDGFLELHGDRAFGDDGAMICGIGWLGDVPVTVVAEEKGLDLKDRIRRNFGCPQPEGYRKSLRLMKQAEKFGRPIVAIVDTQGAFCGVSAEERGQGNALAENLEFMAGLTVPVIAVLVGEGGSGGALALAVGNKVAMLEHAVYSVLSPEGFASILWKDGKRAPEAADLMKMSARDVYDMGIIDAVLDEGPVGAHETPDRAAASVRAFIEQSLAQLMPMSREDLREQRYTRFRSM